VALKLIEGGPQDGMGESQTLAGQTQPDNAAVMLVGKGSQVSEIGIVGHNHTLSLAGMFEDQLVILGDKVFVVDADDVVPESAQERDRRDLQILIEEQTHQMPTGMTSSSLTTASA
jgi:hypothetical protein